MVKAIAGSTLGGQTIAHPVGIAMLVVCAIAILMQPRHRVVLPLLFFIVAIPSAQRLVIATIDFSFIRILVLVTLFRMFSRGEGRSLKKEKPDSAILYWMGWGIVAYGILMGFSGIITRTGYMVEVVGAYYIGRVYVTTTNDIRQIALMLGLLSIPILVFFFIERATGKNMFSVFGGVPEHTLIRDGRLRCQGPFSHPIMAGVFWASLLPWLAGMWITKSASKLQIAAFIGCISLIVANTASSTPIMAVLFSLLGISMFGLRYKMPLIKKCVLMTLITLHMVMQTPIWHLISRINLSGSSTGWHRFMLIDQSLKHVGEWWFVGVITTAHWGHGLQDITNQYLLEAVRGGMLEVIFFVLFISRIFSFLGKALRSTSSKPELWIIWTSGVMLFVHAMNFLAIAYFGQMASAFYLSMGAIVSIASNTIRQNNQTTSGNFNV